MYDHEVRARVARNTRAHASLRTQGFGRKSPPPGHVALCAGVAHCTARSTAYTVSRGDAGRQLQRGVLDTEGDGPLGISSHMSTRELERAWRIATVPTSG